MGFSNSDLAVVVSNGTAVANNAILGFGITNLLDGAILQAAAAAATPTIVYLF